MEALECKVCVLEYSEDNNDLIPRILTCGHTICQACAKTLHEREDRRKVVCPFDRTETSTTDIEQLPRNFSILEVLREREEEENEEVSDEEYETVLSDGMSVACAENTSHDAVWFCENCNADYCNNCFESTHTSRVLSGHKKQPLSEKPFQLPKCPNHPRNIAEFLCCELGCDVTPKTICHTCLLTSHSNHHFEELMSKITEKVDVLNGILQEIRRESANLESKMEVLEGCGCAFDENGESYQDKALKISMFFDEQKEIALKKLSENNTKKKQMFDNCKIAVQGDLRMMNEVGEQLESVLSNKSDFDFSLANDMACVGNAMLCMRTTNVDNLLTLLDCEVVLPNNIEVHFISP